MRAGSLLFQAARENVAKCRACNFAKTQSSLAEKLARSDSIRVERESSSGNESARGRAKRCV